MKAILCACGVAAVAAAADQPPSCHVRAEIWEIGNAAWASALDSMASPDAWRSSLLLAPDSRLVGAWVVASASNAGVAAGRERIYPVEYPSEVGLSAPPPPAVALPKQPVTLLDLYEAWLRAKSHQEFEVREEGWQVSIRHHGIRHHGTGERYRLHIEIAESNLRGFVTYGFNPLVIAQPEFSRFSMNLTCSIAAGRWEIAASQQCPPPAGGGRGGRQRVLLVRCDARP
jgi:hypothetical protein